MYLRRKIRGVMYFIDGVVDHPCQCEGIFTFRRVHNVSWSSILPFSETMQCELSQDLHERKRPWKVGRVERNFANRLNTLLSNGLPERPLNTLRSSTSFVKYCSDTIEIVL